MKPLTRPSYKRYRNFINEEFIPPILSTLGYDHFVSYNPEKYHKFITEVFGSSIIPEELFESFYTTTYNPTGKFTDLKHSYTGYQNYLYEALRSHGISMEDQSSFVYTECNGILYHITETKFRHKILKYGLIPKHLDKQVSHPGRIYCLTTDGPEEHEHLAKLLYDPGVSYTILKIDLNKMPQCKPKFFMDPAYDMYGVFTCENISPACISVISKNITPDS